MINEHTKGLLLIEGDLYGRVFPVVSYMRSNRPPHEPKIYILRTGGNSFLKVQPKDVVILGGEY